MITNFSISHFRGIRNLRLQDLGSLNVFVGFNNCGKSTALEALFLFCDPSHPSNDIQINRARHFHGFTSKDMALNFYNFDTNTPILFDGSFDDGSQRKVEIKYFEYEPTETSLQAQQMTSRKSLLTYGLENKIEMLSGGESRSFSFQIQPVDEATARIVKKQTEEYAENIPSGYLPPSSNINDVTAAFEEMVKNKQDMAIVDVLREIEPKIERLTTVNGEILADIGLSRLIPIQLLGDGIRKLFAIIIFIFQLRGGIALLDEVDNGLHYKSMPSLWRAIVTMAQKYNTQLFVTTHNIDSLKALSTVLTHDKPNFQDSANILTLRKNNLGDVVAIRSQYEQFDFQLEQQMELR